MKQKTEKAANDLDFYKNRDDTHPHNLLYEPPIEDFYGPVNSEMRSCTDYACIVIWFVFLAFSFAYGYYAFNQSIIDRIYYPNDFRTDLCGLRQLASKPYAYYLDPTNLGDIAICVSSCPSTPDYTQQICLYDTDGVTLLPDYCYDTYYTDTYMRYCMPMALGARRSSIEAIISTDLQLAKRIGGDFWINIQLIVGAFAVQIVIGIIYVLILLGKRVAHLMLWAFVTGFCISIYYQASYIDDEKADVIARDCQQTADPYQCTPGQLYFLDFVKYTFIATIPVYVTLLILFFHKILRMVQVMENMLKPLRQLPRQLLIPLVISLLQAVLGIIYMLLFIGGVSAGLPATVSAPTGFASTNYRKVSFELWQGRGFYVITFFYLWTLQAMYYYCRAFLACSSSVWYYSRDKNFLNNPILRPLWFITRYHLGSFLLGGLFIPAVWMFNAVFYFWKQMLEAIPRKSFGLSVLLFISIPGFWLYEHISKYVSNRNFIHISIFGDNFWTSGQKVFYLRERNYSRVEMIRQSLGFVRLIGMLLIASGGSYLVYYSLFDQQIVSQYVVNVNQSVYYPIVPALFTFITGLYLAQNFSSVIDIISEVMVFDLIADEEMFMGQQRFADQDMMDFANKFSQEKQKKDFVVTNQGRVNPQNDVAGINDIIKPMNVDDLANQDGYEQEEPEQEPEQIEPKEQSLNSDINKQFDQNVKGIDMDDLDDQRRSNKDDDFEDENTKFNKISAYICMIIGIEFFQQEITNRNLTFSITLKPLKCVLAEFDMRIQPSKRTQFRISVIITDIPAPLMPISKQIMKRQHQRITPAVVTK